MTDYEKIKSFDIGDNINDVKLFQKHYPYNQKLFWENVIITNKTNEYIDFQYVRRAITDSSKNCHTCTKRLYFFNDYYLSMIKP